MSSEIKDNSNENTVKLTTLSDSSGEKETLTNDSLDNHTAEAVRSSAAGHEAIAEADTGACANNLPPSKPAAINEGQALTQSRPDPTPDSTTETSGTTAPTTESATSATEAAVSVTEPETPTTEAATATDASPAPTASPASTAPSAAPVNPLTESDNNNQAAPAEDPTADETEKYTDISQLSKDESNDFGDMPTAILKAEELTENSGNANTSGAHLFETQPLQPLQPQTFQQPHTKALTLQRLKANPKILILISLAAIVLLALIFTTGYSLIKINGNQILHNVKINGIDVQGLTREEALQKVSHQLSQTTSRDITITINGNNETINPEALEFAFNVGAAAEDARNTGRSGNILSNICKVLFLHFKGENITCDISYSESAMEKTINDLSHLVPGQMIDNSYYIEDNNLFIVKGKTGYTFDDAEAKNTILHACQNAVTAIEISVATHEVPKIDIDQIYAEVHTEPNDASFTNTNGKPTISPHVLGISFDVAAAKQAIETDKEEYMIPLKITYPNTLTDHIGLEAFPNKLSTYSTKYNPGQTSRSENLRISSNKINGKVIMPGETFSYNEVLGKRTIENGYKEAGVYEGGKVVQGVGGGICQISSTLYNSVLLSNLEIVERTNHGLPVGYVPPSRDATVSYGTIDFKFKNSRSYPIKIISSVSGGTVTIDIVGMYEDIEYDVIIEHVVTETLAPRTEKEYVSTLEPGTEKVVQSGVAGCRSNAYRTLMLDGKVISRTLISTDKYSPMNTIIQVGKA